MADESMPVLEVSGLTKTYRSGDHEITVLSDVSLAIGEGETCAIVGPSGSGKTTLLGLSAGLDRPSRGSVRLCGTELGPLDEDQRAAVRSQFVGFVFQTFQSCAVTVVPRTTPANSSGTSDWQIVPITTRHSCLVENSSASRLRGLS